MPPDDLGTPPETPQDPIHISDENAISIDQALAIANEQQVSLGKSTLQRWAQHWKELHKQNKPSPVKVVLWIVRGLKSYRLDREEFKAWLFELKQNMRPHEVLRDPAGSHETPQGPKRPKETSQGSERFQADREAKSSNEHARKLESEIMNLKIDVEVRKQLLDRARDEIEQGREREQTMLRHIGGLELQVRQLSEPKQPEQIDSPAGQDQTTHQTDFSAGQTQFNGSQST